MDVALGYFSEVVRHGSIRKAAEALNVSASSISRQIQNLEHSFGSPLIHRHSQGVKLTAEGEIVARFVVTRSREMERLRSSISDLRGLQSGYVRIFTVEGMIGGLLSRAMAMFSSRHPNIAYEVRVGGTDTVMQAVAEDRCDIGISFQPLPRPNVDVVASIEQPVFAVMAPSHPLAGKSQLTLEELEGEPIGLADSSFGIRHLVDHAMIAAQCELLVQLESNSIEMLRQFAAQKMGIVFLPAFACEREITSRELVAIKVDNPALASAQAHICKYSGAEPTRAAHALTETLIEVSTHEPGVAFSATPRKELSSS